MRLTDELPLPFLAPGPAKGRTMDCKDGRLLISDIARAAHVSPKQAKRDVEAYCDRQDDRSHRAPHGATLEVGDLVPDPSQLTRMEMARIIAERVGIGRYGARKRAAERRAAEPQMEDPVTSHTHPWKIGTGGRSVRTVERGHQIATLTCGCGATKDIRFRELAGAEQMDQKFRRAGWLLDPSQCQTCAHPRKTKETPLSTTPSPAAIRSQATMFRLLTDHFDADAGRFAEGWSDEKIAKDTGLSAQTVAAFRSEAFGAIKEPAEIAALAADIETLDGMIVEAARTVEGLKTEAGALKQRLGELRRKY